MSPSDWRKTYRDATAAPSPGARARVWHSMQQPRATTRWIPVLAFAAVAAAVLAIVWPRTATRAEALEGFAYQATEARFERSASTFSLESGRLVVSAWQTPVVVTAAGRRIEIDAAVAVIEVAGETLRVVPLDGTVIVDGAMQRPTEASAPVQTLTEFEPADAPLLRAEARAALATQHQRWDEAAAELSIVARSSSLRAEAALLKRGELELRFQKRPEIALATFDEGDARFPTGPLAEERALSALEAAVALKRPDVVTRASVFLSRFPASHRASDVRAVQAQVVGNTDETNR